MLEPLQHHDLLLFWLQVLVLFATARGLGLLAQRLGQPSVVGELTAGLLIGPSLLGRVAPGVAGWLFPGDAQHSASLLAVAWIGVVLLLVETGFETDLRLLRRIGRSTALVPVGSLLLPLALGVSLGFVMPAPFVAAGRPIFALFIGVALAVSALPVVAKILIELRLMRRNVGQIIIVAGMVDDIVGWLMLSALAGAAASGHLEAGKVAMTIVALVGFVAVAFTLGQRATDSVLRRSLAHTGDGVALPVSALMAVVLVFAAVTQAIGIEAVFGAFVAGIVIARSRYHRPEFERTIHAFSHGVFAPIFFATAGMYVDLGRLADAQIAIWAAIVLVVASVGKLVGSYVGARMGPLGHREAIAVGVGLNARGALEIIIATIALSIGVFNQAAYTVIVLLAMTTSIAAPPLLRWALRNLDTSDEEAARLEHEQLMDGSVIAKARTALLPTRGGANSAAAAGVLDLALQPEAHVTVLTVRDARNGDAAAAPERLARVSGAFAGRDVEVRHAAAERVAAAILAEAHVGYDLIALGLNEDFRGTHELSAPVRELLADAPSPVLLVRRGSRAGSGPPDGPARILVAITGTTAGRAAEEIAYSMAARTEARVDLVHVLSRPDRHRREPAAAGQLSRAQAMAERFGPRASALLREGPVTAEEILAAAQDREADLLVLGAQLRRHEDGRPFLGHGAEYLLEHAEPTVVVVVLPHAQA